MDYKKILNLDKLAEVPHNCNNIVLIQQFFVHSDPARQAEIQFCLKKNLENPNIEQIILLNEREYSDTELGISAENNKLKLKLKQVVIGKRLCYADVFKYALNYKDTYIILSNADIFFGPDIVNLRRSCLSTNKSVYTLLRYEYSKDCELNDCQLFMFPSSIFNAALARWDSQDTWIFHSNHISADLIQSSQFNLGKPGCDNKIAFIFDQHGYTCYNAVRNIKSYHYHSTGLRNYNREDIIPGPYLFILPDSYAKA